MYFPPPPPFLTLGWAFLPLPLQLCSGSHHYCSLAMLAYSLQSCLGGKSPGNRRMAHEVKLYTSPATLHRLNIHCRCSLSISTS